jgi:hypothetical protein
MGFNLNHISDEIVVGDISPASMQELLREKWEVREHLSLAIVNIYGGHVLQAVSALRELLHLGSSYGIRCSFPSDFSPSLVDFISQCEASTDLRSRVIPFLEKLAVEGFVPAEGRNALDRPLCAQSRRIWSCPMLAEYEGCHRAAIISKKARRKRRWRDSINKKDN